MRLETIAIGDELLTGKIADTNTAYVADQVFKMGLRLNHSQTAADEPGAIRKVVDIAKARAQMVFVFGGLGPTSDDRTAEVIAGMLNTTLVDDETSLERLMAYLKKRGHDLTPQRAKQVKYPKAATPLPNPVGAAPGFHCILSDCEFFFLPGVPTEMKAMFQASVFPRLHARLPQDAEVFHSHTWRCVGIPEAELQRVMDPVEAGLPSSAYLGYRTRFPENHLTLYWKGREEVLEGFKKASESVREILHPWCYSEKDQELEEIVFQLLRSRKCSLAFAESCTGGLCAERMTRVPGSSEFFWGSAVVYQAAAKKALLGVELESPEQAVSAACSQSLAESLAERSGCPVVAAVTGYMGPAGGTQQDPVGTSYIHVRGLGEEKSLRVYHPGFDRLANQHAASTYLLNLVRLVLEAGQ